MSVGKQRRQNVDDTESEGEGDNGEVIDAERPWLAEWNLNCYEKTHEAVPEGMGIRVVHGSHFRAIFESFSISFSVHFQSFW